MIKEKKPCHEDCSPDRAVRASKNSQVFHDGQSLSSLILFGFILYDVAGKVT